MPIQGRRLKSVEASIYVGNMLMLYGIDESRRKLKRKTGIPGGLVLRMRNRSGGFQRILR